MIDSHCHLADKQFTRDLNEVLHRAHEVGVDRTICIADDLIEAERCIAITNAYASVFATVGVHPHHAKYWKDSDSERIKQLIQSSNKVVALGEIGLDYHYDNSPRDVQRNVCEVQLALAKELELPAVIHNRDSIADLMQIMDRMKPQKAVLHCCTEKWEDVSEWVKRGYFLSFTGIATYPKSEEIRRTIRECPLSQMMIETDAPYLAPVPHRGKRNEPSYVVEVATLISVIKGVSLAEVDAQTTRNTVEFFGLSA